MVVDVVMKLYYEEVLDPSFHSPSKMQELMEKTMNQVRKQNFSAFLKHLFVCNPIIGDKFLKEVQMHYDMSFELEVLAEKIQMLVTSCVSNEQKVKWFKKWNQLAIAREVTKFPKQGFLDVVCVKWL